MEILKHKRKTSFFKQKKIKLSLEFKKQSESQHDCEAPETWAGRGAEAPVAGRASDARRTQGLTTRPLPSARAGHGGPCSESLLRFHRWGLKAGDS